MRVWWLFALLSFNACRRESPQEHLDRAKSAMFEQKPTVALSEYKLALDALDRDESSSANPVYRARALRGAADVYYLVLGDAVRAAEVYRELIRVCPEAPETLEARVHLAALLQRKFNDVRGAIAELKSALARNPPRAAELEYRVASLYFELQDYQQSEIEAESVASKYENSAWVDDALFLRGQALAMMESRKLEAQRAYMDLVDRFSESPLKAHALFELGRLKAEQGLGERAIELWAESLKTHPNPGVVQGAIARVRARLLATTPNSVGVAAKAFDRDVAAVAPVKAAPRAKTSAEAVGGTREEAEREALGQVDALSPAAMGEGTHALESMGAPTRP
jgi:tetratricopeptide (TPR) repeat protein